MPINVEEVLNALQAQIDVLSECCATCGLTGGLGLSQVFLSMSVASLLIFLGYYMGK